MNSIANVQTGADRNPGSAGQVPGPSLALRSLSPIFLMISSLETGGSERQFVALARSLQADHVPVHLGCLLKQGPLLKELDGLDHFDLGGSLYGVQSVRSRWRLARSLRKLRIGVAHSFDFYSNLTLIPAARLARVPVAIGRHRHLDELVTPAQCPFNTMA